MRKVPKRDYHNYIVDVNVGRSFRVTVKAFSEGHAALIADRMLEETGTKGFIPAHEIWFDIEDSIRTPRGRSKKWLAPRWGYPWESLGAGRTELQALLNELDQEIKKMHDRHEGKTRRTTGKDAP